MSTVGFHTFGCKLNYSETSSISRIFKENGYNKTSIYKNPEKIIINTCSVTENANKKCKDLIKKIKNYSPKSKITVIGCYAQLKPNEILKINGVDKVLGNKEKFDFKNYINSSSKKIHSNIKESTNFNSTFSINERTRSFLKVQDGCNYGCSFCTIPLARGRSRSNTIKNTIKNIKIISDRNIKEIVLTGINIGDFGIQNGKRKEKFINLLQEIDKLKIKSRFRISSIEPNLLDNEIIEFILNSKKFVHHFHIPLQSGNNKILKAMGRRYNKELYENRIKKIKMIEPNACIGADVIVGYPGETEFQFNKTYNYIKNLNINYLHVFPYSERENTRAVKLQNKISTSKKNERSKILRILSEKKKRFFYKKNLKSIKNVLFEENVKNNFMYGFTDNYIKVRSKYDKKLINKIIPCNLESINSQGIVEIKSLILKEKVI